MNTPEELLVEIELLKKLNVHLEFENSFLTETVRELNFKIQILEFDLKKKK